MFLLSILTRENVSNATSAVIIIRTPWLWGPTWKDFIRIRSHLLAKIVTSPFSTSPNWNFTWKLVLRRFFFSKIEIMCFAGVWTIFRCISIICKFSKCLCCQLADGFWVPKLWYYQSFPFTLALVLGFITFTFLTKVLTWKSTNFGFLCNQSIGT